MDNHIAVYISKHPTDIVKVKTLKSKEFTEREKLGEFENTLAVSLPVRSIEDFNLKHFRFFFESTVLHGDSSKVFLKA